MMYKWLFCIFLLVINASAIATPYWINIHHDTLRTYTPKTYLPVKAPMINLHRLIIRFSKEYRIPPALAAIIMSIESNYDSCATSRMGAQGLMQIMPSTAISLGVDDPYDPEQAMEGGIKYLAEAYRHRQTQGNLYSIGAYYNAGPKTTRVLPQKWPKETQEYAIKLRNNWHRFEGDNWKKHVPKKIPRTNRILCIYSKRVER